VGGADGDADTKLRYALLHAQRKQAEDADGAGQQRDGGEYVGGDGDEPFTASPLMGLLQIEVV
jgi:hypothetical protein